MTDDNKNETQDMTPAEETLSAQEAGAAADQWQEELPPEDDFQAPDDMPEEMVEDVLPADEASSSNAATGRSGKGIVVAVLLFGAALIGGLAYLQFSGGSEGSNEGRLVPIASQINIKEIRDAAKQVKADPKLKEAAVAAADATGKVDMTALFHQAQEQAAQQTGSALPIKDGRAPEPTESPSSVEKTGAIVSAMPSAASEPMPPPPLAMPEEAKIAKVETIAVKKEEVQALPSPAQAAMPQADERIKALEAKIGGLTDDLAKATEKNTQLLARVEELQKSSEKAGEADALKARVAELEQKLQARSTTASAPRREPAAQVSVGTDEAKPVKASPVKKAEKKVAAKKKPAEPAPPSWVLRAATPEAAWVSTTRDGVDLRQVSVGQTLTGVGKIKEIKQVGDKWEIIGDKGSLK